MVTAGRIPLWRKGILLCGAGEDRAAAVWNGWVVDDRSFALLLSVDRARLGLSRADLAGGAGVTEAMVAAFEEGAALPAPVVLAALAAVLGWSEGETAPLAAQLDRRVRAVRRKGGPRSAQNGHAAG